MSNTNITKFNKANTGHLSGKYPLFLGEDLGFPDSVNVTYPVIEELYQKQLSQIWNEFEVSLSQDIMEMQTQPTEVVKPLRLTILTQAIGDAIASRSIASVMMPHATNPEFENLINLWAFFETIHNRTYAHLIKQTFENPSEMLEEAYQDERICMRSVAILNAFDDIATLPATATVLETRVAILKAFTALFALEAIMFMSSFAVTFAIAETGVFQGIGKLVEMICKDEVLHTRMDYEVLNILLEEGTWGEAVGIAAPDMKIILDDVVSHELEWSKYVFEEGQIVGLTTELLQEYVQHMAKPVYDALGLEYSFEVHEENPLKYMEKYIDSSVMQVANQEMQSGQYQVGAIVDDTESMTFDEDDLF